MEQIQGGLGGNGSVAHTANDEKPEKKGKRGKNGSGKEPVVGRKDNDGQEGDINVTELKKAMPKAIKLEKDLIDRKADASAAYKRWAKETNTNAAQLRKAAKAYANEEVEAERRKAAQISMIFDECGV